MTSFRYIEKIREIAFSFFLERATAFSQDFWKSRFRWLTCSELAKMGRSFAPPRPHYQYLDCGLA